MHDYVMMWNSIALELNRRDHTGKMNAKNNKGPTLSSRALAIFHLAMHDAFFGRQNVQSVFSGIDGLKTPTMTYLPAALIASLTPPAGGASTEGAAVSGAASTVLLELYPDFKSIVYEALNGFDFNPAMSGSPAFEFGVKVAKAILADRENDGARELGAVPEMERFWRHREDPSDPGQGLLGAVYGTTKLFSASDIPTIADHPVPRSTAYDAAHDLVRDKGVKIGGSRTPYETLLGYYWAYDGASQIGTPPRQYNQVVRQIIAQNVNGPARPAASARLLTLVNVAMADAGIAAWYHKYVYQLWRPILGIREYDNSFWQGKGYEANSFGLHKRCDPWWTPLGSPRTNEPGRRSFTPPFPAYPSGHATFGAAAFEITRRFFGVASNAPDNLAFNLVSDELDGRAVAEDGSFRELHRRHYPSLLQAMFDNAVSRLFLGVHWRFDGLGDNVGDAAGILTDASHVGGVPLGRKLANDIYDSGLAKSAAPRKPGITPKKLPGVNLPPGTPNA